jgi:hypothetical protein
MTCSPLKLLVYNACIQQVLCISTTLLPIFSNSAPSTQKIQQQDGCFHPVPGQRDDHVAAIRLALLPLEAVGIGSEAGQPAGGRGVPALRRGSRGGLRAIYDRASRTDVNRPTDQSPRRRWPCSVLWWQQQTLPALYGQVTPRTVH